jgi:hypothetical protein
MGLLINKSEFFKGKINKRGVLEIERAGKFKPMKCKQGGLIATGIAGVIALMACDDDCPLFEEPQPGSFGKVSIKICKKILVFDEFIDEREYGYI